uniref:RING-type E3 ubiquitin transferase n=1 Tax=Globisporangium ultimum (strain ATCC 200006 / CBS 805.95 / DAOM BR144) TaxID=431595 RepID=K3WJK4_GLOUD
MVKFWLYSSASLLACAGLLYYTYVTRQQFYPAVIYLVTSKISVLILGNAGLVLTMLLGRLVKTLFLGTLRDAEVELLHENVRYAITETCLALTIFRDEINFHVVVLFTSLVFLKIFHWLSEARIEFIEQSDIISRLTHMRLVTLMTALAAVDMTFVVICAMKVMETGPSVFILFGFEFLILFITLVAIFLRYVLYVVDSRMDGTWTNKFTYLFYLELVSEIVKLVIYLVFFMLIFSYYGMPLHIVRDLWVSIKNLQRRIASYFRYRKITANLNERFPNPTEEELQETDRTCIICREEMASEACKKLPCSHIFHIDCLKMWVQRQQTCPTCRSTIPTGPRPPVVPETAPEPNAAAPAAPQAPAAEQLPAPFRFGAPGMPFGAVPHAGAPAAPAPVEANAQVPNSHAAAHPAPATSVPSQGLAQPPHGAAPHPFAGGYPPYMSPYMFAPGMGGQMGYGMPGVFGMAPPFGFSFGQFGMPHGAGPTPGVMDPESIQRQIELLHAQLAMLQAATGLGFPVPPPPGVMHQSQPAAAPTVSVATPAATSRPPPQQPATQPSHREADELEEKSPVPSPSETSATETAPAPVERPVPPAPQTEAERRREELRRRYNRIYGESSSATGTTSDSTDESKKSE